MNDVLTKFAKASQPEKVMVSGSETITETRRQAA
jgi:hypothetical protein